MKIGKTLAISAVTGILAALSGCGGESQKASPMVPSTDIPAPTDKNCCKGKNDCKNKSGCKAGENASCAGKNDCKGKGTSCPKA